MTQYGVVGRADRSKGVSTAHRSPRTSGTFRSDTDPSVGPGAFGTGLRSGRPTCRSAGGSLGVAEPLAGGGHLRVDAPHLVVETLALLLQGGRAGRAARRRRRRLPRPLLGRLPTPLAARRGEPGGLTRRLRCRRRRRHHRRARHCGRDERRSDVHRRSASGHRVPRSPSAPRASGSTVRHGRGRPLPGRRKPPPTSPRPRRGGPR